MKKILRLRIPAPRFVRPAIRAIYLLGVAAVEGFAVLRKLLWIEPVLRSVCERVGRGLRAECLPYMRGHGRLVIGEDVHLSGKSCFYFMSGMPETPEISVGDRVFIGHGCTLSSARRIVIGNDCLISSGVRVHDNDGHPVDPERRRRKERIAADEVAEVVVGDNVWVGANAIILKGVKIGTNAVVGAGAIVTSDVPANATVGGNPAKVVREQ